MSAFLNVLAAYCRGEISSAQLLQEIERQRTNGESDVASLAELAEVHALQPIEPALHAQIVQAIRGQTHAPAAPPDPSPAGADYPITVIMDGRNPQDSAGPLPENRRKYSLSVGTVLKGRFQLIELIGEGGMSTVYRAIDRRKVEERAENTQVAVKLLTVPAFDLTRSLEVLQAEAQKLEQLPHPNIVRVIECDRDGRTVFMTMELLAGESLARRMVKNDFRPLSPADAERITAAIASGLAFAHQQGIVHGDLKPGNVFLTDAGEVKIIDFGVARLLTRNPGTLGAGDGRPKLSALTPPYASPEMLESGEPDPRDDIYGLACIAYEMRTGRHPFDRKVATEARDSGLQLPQHSALSATQLRAISHALEFDRARRTATAEEFIQEFNARASVRPAFVASLAGVLVLVGLAAVYLFKLGALPWFALSPRATLSSHPPGAIFRDCPNCPRMTALPAGTFSQGAAEGALGTAFETPRHPVAIARPFAIGVYEVTVAEFRDFTQATGFRAAGCDAYDGTWKSHPELNWSNPGYPQTPDHPVTCVSWRDAHTYSAWLSQRTGRKYRLLSESEWEFAARAGAVAALPWASSAAACTSANVADQSAGQRYPGWLTFPCKDGFVYTAPVGSFRANAFGLYDMLGNAAEWVEDCWHPDYQGAPADGTAWLSGNCTEHSVRGGSWFTAPATVSLSARNRFADDYRSNSVGFRLAREMEQ